MGISVKRKDLAAGNGKFTWFDPPKRDIADDDPLGIGSVMMHSSYRRGSLTSDDTKARPVQGAGPAQHSRRPTLQQWVSSVRERRLSKQAPSNRSAASQRQQPPRLKRASTTRPKPDQKSEPKQSPGLRATSMPGSKVIRKPLFELKQASPTIPETDDEDDPDA